MAKGGKDEHRMLFDIRGKRRNVVKVVYGILALLMGLSLLLVAGPLPFGDIFGAQDAQEEARDTFEEQEQRLERKLAQSEGDPTLLLTLTKTHISAANNLNDIGPNGEPLLTEDSQQEYEQAASTWDEYLEATNEPNVNLAQQMAATLLNLALTSSNGQEAEANIKAWAVAQEMVAKARPSLGSLSTLALYLPFTFDYAGAKKAAAEAKEFAVSKAQREQLDNQLKESEKNGREFEKSLKEEEQLSKSQQESQAGGGGSEGAEGGGSFTNPFGTGSGISE